jgi:hypothetical protein
MSLPSLKKAAKRIRPSSPGQANGILWTQGQRQTGMTTIATTSTSPNHLPDGFVAGTEQYRQGIETISGVHASADTFILLHAEQRLAPDADVNAALTVMADRLSRYPNRATEKDYLLYLVTHSLKGQGDVLREGTEMDVSGHRFFRADYKINGHGYQTVMLTRLGARWFATPLL